METRTPRQQSRGLNNTAKATLLIVAVVLLLRLPFLNQAIQGDDVYYIAAAQHAQIEPLHPNHIHYIFEGRDVDFRGYPHPPLNAWVLAGLIAIFGDVREIPFHFVYIAFSLVAALSMLSLARRFSPHPVWATLLFIAAPAFVVNGNSLESDIPFLAFWMAGFALFISRRFGWAALSFVLAATAAVQAVAAIPILALYTWLQERRSRAAWAVTLTPLAGVIGWQVFEFISSGQFPAAVAAGYQQSYGYQRWALKLRNAGALAVHACFLVCPPLLPMAWWASRKDRDRDTVFLAGWIGLFFASALIFFYAGSARYLLPMVAPVALLASRIGKRWLAAGFATQIALSLGLATVNYQHWGAYRDFAAGLPNPEHRRVWVNAEWGLRYYLEANGALPLHRDQFVPSGDLVVESELAYPVPYQRQLHALVPVSDITVAPRIPLRVIGLDTHSGYSTVDKGFLPFGISSGPIDHVRAAILEERQPSLSYVRMNAPQAAEQILFGIYSLESDRWRWMSDKAAILLKSPSAATPIHIAIYIPDQAPARTVSISLDGKSVVSKTFPGPGSYSIETDPVTLTTPTALLQIAVDRTWSVPGDNRKLGLILTEAGFRK